MCSHINVFGVFFPRRDANDSNLCMRDVNNCRGNAASG